MSLIFNINDYTIKIENKNGSMLPSPYSLLLAKNIPIMRHKKVLDLGCGSGFLGIVVYKYGNSVRFSDILDNCLLDSELNCESNNIDGIFIKSDLFENIKTQKFDLILCNPPSLPSKECKKQEYSSGKDGRKIINRLLLEI